MHMSQFFYRETEWLYLSLPFFYTERERERMGMKGNEERLSNNGFLFKISFAVCLKKAIGVNNPKTYKRKLQLTVQTPNNTW